MNSIFGGLGGWNKVAQRYGTDIEPQGTKLETQTIKVGAVRWKWCVTVVLSPQGMYIRPGTGPAAIIVGRLAPAVIPWSEFKKPHKGHLYVGWKAVEMSVGEPEIVPITFPLALYQQMAGYLTPSVVMDYAAAAGFGTSQTGEMMNKYGQRPAFCAKCGMRLTPEANFCAKCGNKVANVASTQCQSGPL